MGVRCATCGSHYTLSARRVYQARKDGRELRCEPCRRPPVEMSDAERKALERWWLERFSIEEIKAMAQGMSFEA